MTLKGRFEKNKWEAVYVNSTEGVPNSPHPLLRLSVPGGWIIKTLDTAGETTAVCFYPDPNRDWNPEEAK